MRVESAGVWADLQPGKGLTWAVKTILKNGRGAIQSALLSFL